MMTTLREAAMRQALEALEYHVEQTRPIDNTSEAIAALKAALAEEALQRLTDVQQEMERNFCPRCGKRTNDIHTCTPPHEEHFCDTHCTWADHAPGCVRAEPVQEPVAWLDEEINCAYTPEELDGGSVDGLLPLYTAQPQRPAEPVQEPVATWENKYGMKEWQVHALRAGWMPAPPQRKPLSEEEIEEINRDLPLLHMQASKGSVAVVFARAIERAHGIGGSNG